MQKKRIAVILLAVLVILPCILCTAQIVFVRNTRPIFSGIEFSAAYTDRDGKLLQVFLTGDDKYRIYKPVTAYPPEFLDLLLLQEDRYFYGHWGVNPLSLMKGFWETYVIRKTRIGGSTITMQTAKLKYRLYTRSLPGKIRQIAAALFLEACYTKQEILELYLNLAPCGKNLEGFEAGAWYYFNQSVSNLNITEAAMLCVLPQNPNSRTPQPGAVPAELTAARRQLFDKWTAAHPEDTEKTVYMNMDIPLKCRMPDETRHFTEMLNLQNGGTQPQKVIRTTIDLNMQKRCENLLGAHISRNKTLGVNNGAVLLIDSASMEVIAYIGSADYYNNGIEGQVNAATAKRSPGSTLKPFIYALALEQGAIHSHTMLKDTPVTFNEYAPDNYGSIFKGPIPAWFALADSRNIPAIALANKIRDPDLYAYMQKAGVAHLKERAHYGLSIVLGTADVSMLELTEMYGSLANGGIQKELCFEMNQNRDSGMRMLTEESAYIVRKMLEQNVPPYQTRPQETKKIPVAYKTGTSVGFKDSWTVALFDRYILCVWIGNFDGRGNNAFLGRTMAAPLAFNIADSIIPGITVRSTPPCPSGVSRVQVCNVSGALPTENCGHFEYAWFIPGTSPITKCKIHRKINIDTRTGYRTDETDKPYVQTIIREFWPSDLQALFTQAGLPRLVPPDYPPEEFRLDIMAQGYPPEIISPMSNTQYIFRTDDASKNQLVLCAVADADSSELLWFSDHNFIGRCKPGDKIIWHPEPDMTYTLTVTDTKGRSSTIRVTVTSE